MKITLLSSILAVTLLSISFDSVATLDSLRTEIKDGKRFVVHQVEEKETLYAISRRYQISVDLISEVNPGVQNGLKIGQELNIPLGASESVEMDSPNQVSHLVDMGETLYSISKKYAVSVEELKSWNSLTGNDLDVGQQLVVNLASIDSGSSIEKLTSSTTAPPSTFDNQYHVVEEKQTLFGISQLYKVQIAQLQRWNNLIGNDISIGQQLIVGKGKNSVPRTDVLESSKPEEKDSVVTVVEDPIEEPIVVVPIDADDVPEFNSRTVREGDLEKVYEEGMAMVIANTTSTKKYLALHRTADVGTVMRVKNMSNNLTIYVRVVGKLPDTGDNAKVLLKLSRTAFERLGAVNRQFPVEVSYIP